MTDEVRTAVVIEDDPEIRELLETVLTQAGFETRTAGTGLEGVELVRTTDPLVTTLDVSLPDIDGFEVCRRIRGISDTYVVMLTARSEEIDTLIGLDAGADDYQTKPFRPRELRARIEAILRRPRRPVAAAPAPPAPIVRVDGEQVDLTRSEFDLLAALAGSPGRVLPKNELVRVLWGEAYDTGTLVTEADRRSIEVHLANLRRKIGENPARPRWIRTVRGV